MIPSAPFYIKVYSEHYDSSSPHPYGTNWPIDYHLRWQRSNCEDKNQACALYPSMVHEGKWSKNAGDKTYFQVYVDRSDSGSDQSLRFDAAVGPGLNWLEALSVFNENDQEIAVDEDPIYEGGQRWQLFSENIAPTPEESVGRLDGDQNRFYIVVNKNMSAALPFEDFDYTVRWDTSLTWIQGVAHAWPEDHKGHAITVDWMLNLDGDTQDDTAIPFREAPDEILLRYAGDDRNHACFGSSVSNCIGVWQHSFGNNDELPITLAARGYKNEKNAWGELIRLREAYRFVERFRMQLVEEDKALTFGNDLSDVATFPSNTPASTLGPGAPDPDTANILIKKASGNLFFDTDEGRFRAQVYVAGSVPVVFCMHDPMQCGGTKYCCDDKTKVCLDEEPANSSGYCQ